MKRTSPAAGAVAKRRYSSQQRAQILEQYERSGLSVPDFAAQQGLCAQTLHGWRHQHRTAVAQAALVVSDSTPVFTEVPLQQIFRPSGSWAGELQLPNGTQVRWNPQASLVVLQSLLTQLRRPC
jgi:hypothetical protein